MNTTTAYQLRRLDQALLSLLDERRRLTDEIDDETRDEMGNETGNERPYAVAIDDLLRRHDGPFPAEDVRAVFRAVEAGCAQPHEANP